MTHKSIGYFLQEKDHELRRGEVPTIIVPFYETRVRDGHTQVKVFDKSAKSLGWRELPKEADPQFRKGVELRMVAP